MEPERHRPRGQVLQADAQGTSRPRIGNGKLAASHPGRQPHPQAVRRRRRMSLWRRLGNLISRRRLDAELEKELRFHLDEHSRDLVRRGHTPEEARRLAALALGGHAQVDEYTRDARGTRWLEDVALDLRYSLRTLRQHPGFTTVVLATLALGIGASTVMFAVVNGVLLSPLPYPDPSRLVRLYEQTDWSTQYGNRWGFSYPNYLDTRSSSGLTLAAWRSASGTLG